MLQGLMTAVASLAAWMNVHQDAVAELDLEDRNLQCINVAFLVFIFIWQTREFTSYLPVASKVLIVSVRETL